MRNDVCSVCGLITYCMEIWESMSLGQVWRAAAAALKLSYLVRAPSWQLVPTGTAPHLLCDTACGQVCMYNVCTMYTWPQAAWVLGAHWYLAGARWRAHLITYSVRLGTCQCLYYWGPGLFMLVAAAPAPPTANCSAASAPPTCCTLLEESAEWQVLKLSTTGRDGAGSMARGVQFFHIFGC